ncbi:MAG: ATP-binding protein [Brevinematales bacterium]|nr:ATP-binding protein [Brevinematales bacterium]
MVFSSKRWALVVFAIDLGVSLFFAWMGYRWMVSLQGNATLRFFVPLVLFSTSFLGIWLIYRSFVTFLFQRRGIRGYKLRGKITFFFLGVTFGTILVVGGVMFYLILLTEVNFIDKEYTIAEKILAGYQDLIAYNKSEFERWNMSLLKYQEEQFPVVFGWRETNLFFLRSDDTELVKLVIENRESLLEAFANPEKKSFFLGEEKAALLVKKDKRFFAVWVPEHIQAAYRTIYNSRDEYKQMLFLKKYIRVITLLVIVVISVPVFFLAFVISIRVAKNLTGSIEALTRGTKILALGNLDYRVEIHSGDELEDLAKNFNAMAEKLSVATRQIKRMERLEAWKEMAKRLAHEIKNPLTPIKLSAERLLYAYTMNPDGFEEVLEKTSHIIINETKRLENLVNQFSKFARLPDPTIGLHDFKETVEEVYHFFKNAYTHVDLSLEIQETEEGWEIPYDHDQIKQVIINLVQNACEAARPEKPKVTLRIERKPSSVLLMVADNGHGIPPEIQDKIFEPYFTTKNHGTGLGLAIVERLVTEHHGYIWFESSSEGTHFYVELPSGKMQEAGDEA